MFEVFQRAEELWTRAVPPATVLNRSQLPFMFRDPRHFRPFLDFANELRDRVKDAHLAAPAGSVEASRVMFFRKGYEVFARVANLRAQGGSRPRLVELWGAMLDDPSSRASYDAARDEDLATHRNAVLEEARRRVGTPGTTDEAHALHPQGGIDRFFCLLDTHRKNVFDGLRARDPTTQAPAPFPRVANGCQD